MKKAKEYAAEFEQSGRCNEKLASIAIDFLQEANELRKARTITDSNSMLPIFNELDDKWKSFARLTGKDINPDGFAGIVRAKFPEVYTYWIRFFPGRAVKSTAIAGPSEHLQAAMLYERR